jgi:hypothetical protein
MESNRSRIINYETALSVVGKSEESLDLGQVCVSPLLVLFYSIVWQEGVADVWNSAFMCKSISLRVPLLVR